MRDSKKKKQEQGKHTDEVKEKDNSNGKISNSEEVPSKEVTKNKGKKTENKSEQEINDYVDRLQRLQAEFENYKKRIIRETDAAVTRASDKEITDFLPLYDNMRRAFSSYGGNNDTKAFIEGMERIFGQFDQVLKQKSVAQMKAVGEVFDPSLHEAMLSVESDEERNTILEEFDRGYTRDDRVLRPSKVKVSKGVPREQEDES